MVLGKLDKSELQGSHEPVRYERLIASAKEGDLLMGVRDIIRPEPMATRPPRLLNEILGVDLCHHLKAL